MTSTLSHIDPVHRATVRNGGVPVWSLQGNGYAYSIWSDGRDHVIGCVEPSINGWDWFYYPTGQVGYARSSRAAKSAVDDCHVSAMGDKKEANNATV